MHAQVGACPQCGSPIYAESPWHGVTPPPSIRTCFCVISINLGQGLVANPCVHHCYCQDLWVGSTRHKSCCKCGDRMAAYEGPTITCSAHEQLTTTMAIMP